LAQQQVILNFDSQNYTYQKISFYFVYFDWVDFILQ
jgi:hypothetical protein